MSRKHYKNQPTVLETAVLGIFKGIWWLIKLPFGGLKKKASFSPAHKQEINKKRLEIEKIASSDNIIELKHAVIEADKLVDKILKLKGYGGQTFADRLRSAEEYVDQKTYQDLWDGHKVRNQIAHSEDSFNQQDLKIAIKKLLNYSKK